LAGANKPPNEGREVQVAGILIVDDEPRIAHLLSRALSACGFMVASAAAATPALTMLERDTYNLLLLDLLLPDLDGFTVLQRALELRPDQEILVLSGLADVESKIKCFELGAADYVTKPFVLAELVARVRARVRESKDLTGSQYLVSDTLKLDLTRHVAVLSGKRHELSTREFHLLEYLMRRMGRVCPREELLASVWGYQFNPNVVDVYVRRLRRKLGDDVIETVRSIGYCYPESAQPPTMGVSCSAA
jgi:DNA-binding response OmpR family regulator